MLPNNFEDNQMVLFTINKWSQTQPNKKQIYWDQVKSEF